MPFWNAECLDLTYWLCEEGYYFLVTVQKACTVSTQSKLCYPIYINASHIHQYVNNVVKETECFLRKMRSLLIQRGEKKMLQHI